MKLLCLSGLAVVSLFISGCGSSVTTGGYTSNARTLTGTVNFSEPAFMPTDAVLMVRVVDTNSNANLPNVLGEQTIKNPGTSPVPFHIEFQSSDELLMAGLNIEARVSVGGKLKYYNKTAYDVKLSTINDPREVWIAETNQ